jgi:hypothetical protein
MPLSAVLQGIHDLSIMLGYEASRDLEEMTVQGVRSWKSFLAHELSLTDHSNRRLARSKVQSSNPGSDSLLSCVPGWA